MNQGARRIAVPLTVIPAMPAPDTVCSIIWIRGLMSPHTFLINAHVTR